MRTVSSPLPDLIGPILFLDSIAPDGDAMQLAALFIQKVDANLPPLTVNGALCPFEEIAEYDTHKVQVARFALPADGSGQYHWNETEYPVAGPLDRDMQIAFVSCNGEEHGDLHRAPEERNAMWARLSDQHRDRPFTLLLHGGDQVYADEATHGHPLSEDWPDTLPKDPARADLDSLYHHLRHKFFERYAHLYAATDFAWIAARVPSLMQWDDHDICDGWGSLQRSRTYSPVGQTLFTVAREAYLTFQAATREGALPERFADPRGHHLGWQIQTQGLRILAPDLRGQRTRRDVMGPSGWAMMEAAATAAFSGRTLLMSSVPLLGPRLSILEALLVAVPSMQKYEDDLRDQWQSRAHRDSWRRMLKLVLRMGEAPDQDLTVLSGEIHLATRATLDLTDGGVLHQLVASGIAHRAPPAAWARILGALSWLGEDPLPEHPVRIRRIPGQSYRYVAERNYLVLERQGVDWSAQWDIESSGRSPALDL
ncbi:alkaline phosphatase family protein [Epibacterium sp. SM1979]|uniref:Alkaline phosphatase family protein n=1 Tax=Tritonibacter litoralis TaxID=2662264 RepID=A0A843YJZ4_9RHOB|nr:alkaline phosphatase D family protein [Tritonibacter litoralis]MQQ09017.1 alkaline phosphatase family protein [Tritonibacter litoralis]